MRPISFDVLRESTKRPARRQSLLAGIAALKTRKNWFPESSMLSSK
jgi:hypothetical protein